MAKKVSENDIQNMSEDWGLDISNGLPYSGEAVQKFIKERLNSKMGYFYYDVTNNRYLCFADEDAKNSYIDNPELTNLILGTFDAPFNYEANITLLSSAYNAIFLGSVGNYLEYTFDIKNKSGQSTGENVNVSYTFIRNASKKVINESRRYGETVRFNIDDYLLEGTNTIIIGITGQTTLAATTVALTYQVVNLQYSDEINISKVYDLTSGPKTAEVFFSVSGYGTKIVEWFLDGEQLPFVKAEDEVVDVSSDRNKYIELKNLNTGIHTLQSRAYTLVNGEKFYTDTLYRELIIVNDNSNANIIALATSIPHSHGIVDSNNPLILYNVEQYVPYTLRFATRKSGQVTVSLDKEDLVVLNSYVEVETEYNLTVSKYGVLTLKLKTGDIVREIPLSVNKTSLNIEEITTSLIFDFNAKGKSNYSTDKDVWSYKGYTGTLKGFKWNAASGWVNNALLLDKDSEFSVDIAPLADDSTVLGKTIEFEFTTRNVEDDNAVVCNLTNNGVGILITASEAKITSSAGEVLSTRFKAGEINRIGFVIQRKTGANYKGLVFIYVNGIISGAINYGTADNFISSSFLSFKGSENAQVELRSIRINNVALSSDNMINNYVLYRDTMVEMMEVYYRNEIYEEGTSSFSTDDLLHYLPVMIITGDIPTLEAATSTSTQILVDIDYINEQDPTKNFKMKNAALRIQGTSSLAYPRKNFRFYTKKEESTLVYDSDNNLITDKLYSFVDGAQPVDCWCLKADYAESSGTHNTGIARLWNKVMYNAIIQHKNILGEETNGYALRTQAQELALQNGYPYDVRTTIDGFPIVLFYKRNTSDTNLIFLGKYNFNNDKSTPSVFGFENIPGFDNSRMQCWETKDNGHPLGLFTDISTFDEKWDEAFESRYPDTKTPNTADLKSFSQWVNGVSQEDFIIQKWEHLDVYKVAAYYVYLMRFGAVDQPVKNGFITSEDGIHFYYINYDNDTINGLINIGELRLDPTIDRQTIGTDGEYVYAGHDSVLWNLCEADTEFMDIVSIVDNALYSAGLRYNEVIKEFNDKQSDKWAERVYNQDAEYKYLLPYVNQATNNLFMLQGSRSSHRSWWLSKRFALYDSLFVSGAYRDRNISFKCLNNTEPGQQFSIVAGTKMKYGYGVNNGIRETGVELNVNGTYSFITTDTLNLGDVVKIFAATDISELNLSALSPRLAVLDCSAASDATLGTKLKKLILGNQVNVNTELESISGIKVLTSLQELNVENYKNIKSLDLTAQTTIKKVFAKGSSIASIDFAKGAPIEHLELPSAMMALNFDQLPYLTNESIILENNFANIGDITVSNCPNISNDFSFVTSWLSEKTIEDANASLKMDNIEWLNVTAADFLEFSRHKQNGLKMTLQGYVYLNSLTADDVMSLKAIWGNDCFNENSDFYISAPPSIYITPGTAVVNEGDSLQFEVDVIPAAKGTVSYRIVSGSREGVTIDANTGLLTTIENGLSDASLYVRAIYTSESGETAYSTASVNVRKRIYPEASTILITGNTTIAQDEVYEWETSAEEINGNMNVDWALSGVAFTDGYVELANISYNNCTIKFIKASEPDINITGKLNLTITKKVDNSVIANKSLSFTVAKYSYPTADNTILNGASQPVDNPVYTWESTATGNIGPFKANWHLDEALLPYYEIDSIEWDENNPLSGSCTLKKIMDVEFYVKGNINLTITYLNSETSFTLSKEIYFLSPDVIMTSETNAPVLAALYGAGLCANSSYMTKAEAEAVQDGSFNPTGSSTTSIFYNYRNEIKSFDEFRYFTSMTTLDAYAFYQCLKLESIKIPKNIRHFKTNCFNRTSNNIVQKLTIDCINVETIESSAFRTRCDLSSMNTHSTLTIEKVNWYNTNTAGKDYAFYGVLIKELNVFDVSAGYSSTSSSYYYKQHFGESAIMCINFDESITSIPKNMFLGVYAIKEINLHNNIKNINTYAFNIQGVYSNWNDIPMAPTVVSGMSNEMTYIGDSVFYKAIFNEDLVFTNLSYDGTISFNGCTFNSKIDLSNNNYSSSTSLFFTKFLYNSAYCKEFILPSNVITYQSPSNASKVEKLFIPNLNNYCNCSFNNGSPLQYANELYIKNNGIYEKIEELDFNNYDITTIPKECFSGAKMIKTLDTSSIFNHGEKCFYNSGITLLKIHNDNNMTSIGTNAYGSCIDLLSIIDTSTVAWANMSNNAFDSVNNSVVIESNVFGLYKQNSEITLGEMSSGVIYAFSFGEKTFSTPNGAYFSNIASTKTITLEKTGVIEDLTDRLKIEHLTLNISSNLETAAFDISYVDVNGNTQNITSYVGNTILNLNYNSQVTITPKEHVGYTSPSSTTIVMDSSIKFITLDYTEKVSIYIAHKDGSLYTESEWTESGNSNDDAEGVCVIRSKSGGFVIAKELSSEENNWGASDSMGLQFYSTLDLAKNDFDGYGNTKRILDRNGTDAIAAITATDYPFPSGEKGYLPAMGELMYIVDNYNKLKDVFALIGSTLFTKNGNSWSSTANSGSSPNLKVWYIYWINPNKPSTASKYIGRDTSYTGRILSFHPARLLKISSNLKTSFTIMFTDINDNIVTQKISVGDNFLSIKYGTQVTITPDGIGNLTAEPQTFTWTGFTNERNFVFAKDAGVYIQHIDGSLYTEEEWTAGRYANSDANGVAILSETVPAFVIAKEDVNSSTLAWGGYGKVIIDIVTATLSFNAILDYNGIGNTSKIIEQLDGYNDGYTTGAPAAEACATFTFPNGKKGYLPALGEWISVYNNNTAVKSAMSLIGGTAIKSGNYWSSTQNDRDESWYFRWSNGNQLTYNKYGYMGTYCYVRAFTAL